VPSPEIVWAFSKQESDMNRAFWNGRRVFLTGHTGFKGSWLSLWLQQAGAQLTGFALEPPTRPSLFDDARVGDGMTSIIGDIRDGKALRTAMAAAAPEVVLHLAAQTVVRTSYDDPVETYDVNVTGTAQVLESVRALPSVRSVVVVTSDKCYENREWLWPYREDDALGGHDPYSNSKACQELVTMAFRRSFFHEADRRGHRVGLATARAGNVVGGGDWTRDQLVPDVMRAFLAGHAVQVRRPEATRPWQFVLEPLHGYLMLAERLWHDVELYSDAWNFGPAEEDARPVGWIVSELSARLGSGSRSALDSGAHPHEAGMLRLDSSRAIAQLGWRPALRLPEALDWVAEWYRVYQAKGDLRALTLDQIRRFDERSVA
jgi:CDP-glucose 4,6-dehydratase